MIGTDYTMAKRMVKHLKSKMSEKDFANLMRMEGADDEKEFELMLTAEAFYLFRDGITIGGKPVDADMIGEDEKVFEARMLLLGTHKGVRKAFMAGDYAKCDRLGNEFFANNPMEENKLRVKRFVDENIDEWEKKGWVSREKKSRKRGRKVRRG